VNKIKPTFVQILKQKNKMKKILFVALVAIILSSCGSKDEPTLFKTIPLATVDIKGAVGVIQKVKSTNTTEAHLTALEIVKQTFTMNFVMSNGNVASRMFDRLQRDTTSTTPMLKMWASDILYYEENIDGSKTTNLILSTDFLEAKNCVLKDINGNILAYIPNSVLRDAETKIKALFLSKDYEAIYPIFNTAYTYLPITESEYAALNQ